MSASDYGRYYWLVERPKSLQWIHADWIEVKDGALTLWRNGNERSGNEKEHAPIQNAVFAAGSWWACHAASVLDGGMVAVEHDQLVDDSDGG